jgi:hypothetical protein
MWKASAKMQVLSPQTRMLQRRIASYTVNVGFALQTLAFVPKRFFLTP